MADESNDEAVRASARFKGIPLDVAKKEAEEWEQWRALVRAGCSIPAHLLKYQRRHEDYLRSQFETMPRPWPTE